MKNQQTTNYRVQIELKEVLKELEKLGLKEVLKGPYWLKVQGKDPDDACFVAFKKVENTIKNKFPKNLNKDVYNTLREHMRILKLIKLPE